MKTLVPLIFAGAVVALAGCATSEYSTKGTLTAVHTIVVKHPLNDSGQSSEQWSLKKNGKGASRLAAKPNETIEWKKTGKPGFYILVLDTNSWTNPQPWIQLPGFECPTCGVAWTAGNSISLAISSKNPPGLGEVKHIHYRIIVAAQPGTFEKPFIAADGGDYDMVDATIIWDPTAIDEGHRLSPPPASGR